jgi:hypothetical protein
MADMRCIPGMKESYAFIYAEIEIDVCALQGPERYVGVPAMAGPVFQQRSTAKSMVIMSS